MIRSGRRMVSRWCTLALAALALSSCDDSSAVEPAGAISLALSNNTVTLTQGASGSVNVTLSRLNGFADAVAVTVEGLPSGVTAPALSLPAGQTSGTLTFTATSAAAVGTSALTVRATGPGVTAATATLSLVVQAAPVGGFTMSLSPSTASVQQGGSTTSTVTIARTAPFAGAVTLAVTGLPAGVTAVFNPISVATSPSTSTLTLTAAATAATGATNLTVTGTGTGVTNQTATLALTVTPATVAGSFTLSLSPAVLSVQQSGTATSTLTIARAGSFSGPVNLTATGLPTGVAATFNPASATGSTSQLTLSATSTATLGSATITITGTGTGVSNVTSTVALTVQPSGGGGGNVSIAFCPSASVGNPVWVAFQDGTTGSWVRSTAVNGVFSGQINSGRGGVAYVVPVTGGGFSTNVFYGTTTELQGFNTQFCYGATGAGKSVNVTVAGLGQTELAQLALGTSMLTVSPIIPGTPVFQGVPDGVIDLIGARASIATGAPVLNRLFIQRGITPAAGSTVAVDFNGANSLAPVTGTVTINNMGADQAFVNMSYQTANRTFFSSAFDLPSTATTRTFAGFPTFAGSFHMLGVIAAPPGTTPDRTRALFMINAAIANRVVTLPSELGTPTISVAGTSPTLRLQALISPGQYTSMWGANFSQGTGASFRSVQLTASVGYFNAVPGTVTLVVPDLGGTAGYDNNWGLANTTTTWFVFGTAISGFGAQGQWQENAMMTQASRMGTFSTEEELWRRERD